MSTVQRIPILLLIVYVYINSGYIQTDCGPKRFRCRNGECIDGELLCDGITDCTDSSDETKEECKKLKLPCPSYAFRCDYGVCINEEYICDGIQDCIDNSDEMYCNNIGNNRTNIQRSFARRCKHDEYGCDNGQCIRITDKCDGIQNCEDGSDETFTLCGSLSCPSTTFRCAYGACINSDLRCDGVANCADSSDEDSKFCEWPSPLSPIRSSIRTKRSLPIHRRSVVISINNCTVPPQPENGHWKLHPALCSDEQDCNVPEGTEVGLGTHLIYSCNPGYELKNTTDVICNFQRKWQPDIPICTEILCKALHTASTSANCWYKNKKISCKSSVPPETSASLDCENSYQPATKLNLLSPERNHVICNKNGQWEPEPMRCIPVCGTLPFDVKPLIVGGYRANITEFPWHVSMYLDKQEEKKFICGASIIKNNLLITATQCVYDKDSNTLHKPSKIHILAGNMFRNYDDPSHNSTFVQRNQVKHIYYSRYYEGEIQWQNYRWNIAILELVTPFVFSATLVPICINTEWFILGADALGKVAGFGTTPSSESNAILHALTIPIVDYIQCSSAFRNTTTKKYHDEFCGGYTNGSTVCVGDVGGGLVFKIDNLWYLRGIVSIFLDPKEEGGTIYCDNNMYSLYTDILPHTAWIDKVVTAIEHNRTHILCSESKDLSTFILRCF